MKRRRFIQYSVVGGGTIILSLGIHHPQQANAFIFSLFGLLLRGAYGFFQIRSQQWWDRRLDVQLAQRAFIRERFTDITVAEVESRQYNVIVAAQKPHPYNLVMDSQKNDPLSQDVRLSQNIGLACPRVFQGQQSIATFAGPASAGMAIAAHYLRENRRLNHDDVEASIIPRLKGDSELNNMIGWSTTGQRIYPNTFSDNGVWISYEAVSSRQGGYGLIDVAVHSFQRIKIPQIRVDFT